jgi:hypothetical protein
MILAVVGTVQSNRRWLQKNIKEEEGLSVVDLSSDENSGWSDLFDEGDAAVREGLDTAIPELPSLPELKSHPNAGIDSEEAA